MHELPGTMDSQKMAMGRMRTGFGRNYLDGKTCTTEEADQNISDSGRGIVRELVKEEKHMERYAVIIRPNEGDGAAALLPGDSRPEDAAGDRKAIY